MRIFLASLLLIWLQVHGVLPAKVLLYQLAVGTSHMRLCHEMVDALVEKGGHEVDLYVSWLNPNSKSAGLSKKAGRIFEVAQQEALYTKAAHLNTPFEQPIGFDANAQSFFEASKRELCEMSFDNPETYDFLASGKYDIVLHSCYDTCGAALAHWAGIPAIATFCATPLPLAVLRDAGIPTPAGAATNFLKSFGHFDETSFWDRAENAFILAHSLFVQLPEVEAREENIWRQRLGASTPGVAELRRQSSFHFVNTHELLEMPQPISSKVKYFGGLGLRKPKALDKEFADILAKSEDGVVLFSFGTQVPSASMSDEVAQNFLHTFAKFPTFTFIWRWDDPNEERKTRLFSKAKNVIVKKWVPQTELLHHNKTVAFITHMGMNSWLEVAHAGKPLVGIPIFADQQMNVDSAERQGVGVQLSKRKLEKNLIHEALEKILYDPRYRKNAQNLAKAIYDWPNDAADTLAKWVGYAAAHPSVATTMNLRGTEQSVIEHYCLDVLALVLLVILVVLSVGKRLLGYLFSRTSSAAQSHSKVHKVE